MVPSEQLLFRELDKLFHIRVRFRRTSIGLARWVKVKRASTRSILKSVLRFIRFKEIFLNYSFYLKYFIVFYIEKLR